MPEPTTAIFLFVMLRSRRLHRQTFLDGLNQAFAFRAGHAAVAVNELAIPTNEVFEKVPLGSLTGVLGQLLKEGHCGITGDRCFGEHWKLHTKRVFTEFCNVLVVAFFLCKVVGRKA